MGVPMKESGVCLYGPGLFRRERAAGPVQQLERGRVIRLFRRDGLTGADPAAALAIG